MKIIVCPGCASTKIENFLHEEGADICSFQCDHCQTYWSVSKLSDAQVKLTQAMFKLASKIGAK